MSAASEEEILRKHLLDLKKQGNMWTGYAPSREAFVGLQRDLASINISFQTEHSYSLKGRLMFSSQRAGGHIAIDENVPFKAMQSVTKGCLFGRDLKKAQESRSEEEREPDWSAATFERKKIKLKRTKKKGCTAVMHIKKVEAYPQFKINLPEKCSKRKREAASKEILSQLKVALQEEASGKPVVRQQRFYVSMSSENSHCNHDIGADCAGYAQPVNRDAPEKIIQLVQESVTSACTVESCFEFSVQHVLFASRQSPSSPSRTDVKNDVQRALTNDRCCSVDQESSAVYVEQLQEKTPTKCFFRAYQTKTAEAGSPEGDEQQVALADTDTDSANSSDHQTDSSDSPRASQQPTHHMKLQIRTKSSQVLSFLYHIHDQAVLQHILSLLSEANKVAQANVATSNGITIRGSPTEGCSRIERKRRTEVSVDAMKLKGLPTKKKCLSHKERLLSHGQVEKKEEMMRAYKAPNLIQTLVVEPWEQNHLLPAVQESQS